MLSLLENNVRLQILFCLSLFAFVFVPLSLLMCVPVVVVGMIFRVPSLVVLIVGILCATLLCWFGDFAYEIFRVNHNALMGFFHSSLHVTANDFLISFPLSCLMNAAVFQLHENRNPLHLRLRDLSRGKLGDEDKKLPDNVIEDLLSAITTSAVEGGNCIGVDVHAGERIVLTDQQMNLHTLSVGTTGSGKTTGICNIVDSVVTRGLPLFTFFALTPVIPSSQPPTDLRPRSLHHMTLSN